MVIEFQAQNRKPSIEGKRKENRKEDENNENEKCRFKFKFLTILEGEKTLSALDLVHSCFDGEILFGLFLCVRTGKV